MTLGIILCCLSFVCGYLSLHLWPRWRHWARRARWQRKSRSRGGRLRIDRELIALIGQVSAANPLWGAPRIHGELLKLGFDLSQSSVSRYMLPRGDRPAQGWTFLRNHAGEIGMVCVPTLTFRRLYAFVILGRRHRAILHVEVTDHPTARWRAHQIGRAFGSDALAALLARDDEGAYDLTFHRPLRARIRDGPAMPDSGHVERLIGSIRRECLDPVIILNAAHLRRVLRAYARSYNENRTHFALDEDLPGGRTDKLPDAIGSPPALGGLHRRHRWKPSRHEF